MFEFFCLYYTASVNDSFPQARPAPMLEQEPNRHSISLRAWFRRLPRGKKIILVVFLIWFAQALPKWTAAITADGELSARIMKLFVTPR